MSTTEEIPDPHESDEWTPVAGPLEWEGMVRQYVARGHDGIQRYCIADAHGNWIASEVTYNLMKTL